jgi:hypothetical protein
MCFSAGSGAAKREAARVRADEEARKGRIKAGMSQIDGTFSKFNEQYYGDRAKDYTDFAMPQLERQSKMTRDDLIYALSRTGNLDSSAAIKKNNDLTYDENIARISIADEGLNKSNALRNQVENTRSNLVAQLNATGDNSASANAAVRQATNLETPVGYSPLGNMFANFAQTIGNIGSNGGNGYQGFAGGAKLFGGSGNSQTVVGG